MQKTLPYLKIEKLDVSWLNGHFEMLAKKYGFDKNSRGAWLPIDFLGVFPVFAHYDSTLSKDFWGLSSGFFFKVTIDKELYDTVSYQYIEHNVKQKRVVSDNLPLNELDFLKFIDTNKLWDFDPRSPQNDANTNKERTRVWIKALINDYPVIPINLINCEKEVISPLLEKKFHCKGINIHGNIRQILIEDVSKAGAIQDELSLRGEECIILPCYSSNVTAVNETKVISTNDESVIEDERKVFNCNAYDLLSLNEDHIDDFLERPNEVLALIFSTAIDDGASDIHIHEIEEKTNIRFRINNRLHDKYSLSQKLLSKLNSIISQHSGISYEKKLTHSGNFSIIRDEKRYDIRVSLMPCGTEQSCVLRFHGRESKFATIETIGLSEEHERIYRNALRKKSGILLVTGPTGSGKSTTLYAGLEEVSKDTTLSIETIEDPVEKKIERVKQFQVVYYKDEAKAKQNLSFPVLFREVLRHDPDVIMVGEIRDKETAMQAVQAAQTGHLVLSTLHTNDAIGAIKRLGSFGIHPEQFGNSLILLQAQRLLSVLCPECKVRATESDAARILRILKDNKIEFDRNKELNLCVCREGGCRHCRGTGFSGKKPVFEFLPIDQEIRYAIEEGKSTKEITDLAKSKGFQDFFYDALSHVFDGIMDFNEACSYGNIVIK